MRISQVVSNLVSNAIKFTEKGSVVVSISTIAINNDNLRLQIKVKDTGAGLTASVQEKLFDAFSQADTAVARKYGGSGLGLTIVRKLIEQMQGFINVRSSVGEGTEFTIHLDLKIDKRKKADIEKKLTGLSVLLYESDAVNEKLLETLLQDWRVDIDLCRTDDDFIGHLMKYKKQGVNCDCIILGMANDTLSVNSIEELVKKIRHLSSAPVVLMLNTSEYALPSHVIDEKVCYLGKPVKRQVLYSKLSSIKHVENIRDVVCIATSTFKNLKILVAEDNTFNRELLTDMLVAFGAQVTAVDDGQLAVEAALNDDYDIIFLDLHMPRKDGISAANEIRQATLKKSPLLVAATADVFIKEQGSDVDVFDSFVFKPIREEVLLEKIATLLNFQGEYKDTRGDEKDLDPAFSEKLDREVRKLVLHIVDASNNDDYAEILNYAHQLRGVCGFYELTEMTVLASGLEKSAKDKKREDVILLIKVLLKKLNISPDYKNIH
jgi:two-component system sensor histidine kinase BarA